MSYCDGAPVFHRFPLMHPAPARSLFILRPVIAATGLLAFGLIAALAQTPRPAPAQIRPTAPPNLDGLQQREKELEALRAEQKRTLENEAKLKREIESIGDDRRKFNQQLIETAARVAGVEDRIDKTQERLNLYDESEQGLRKSLEERRQVIAEVLAALQRIGRHAPPVLMMRAEDALQSVRSAMMLGAVLPEMRHQTESVASDLGELVQLRKQITDERDKLARDLFVLADERQRLSLLIEERQKKQGDIEKALAEERQRAAALARQAADVKDLIVKLEQGLDSVARAVPAGRPFGWRQKGAGYPPRPRRPQGPRTAGSGRRVRVRQGNAAAARQRGENQGIRRSGRDRKHRKGPIDRHPEGQPDHGSV